MSILNCMFDYLAFLLLVTFDCRELNYIVMFSYHQIEYHIQSIKINYHYLHVFSSVTTKLEYKNIFPHFVAWGPLRKLDFSVSAKALETVSIVSMETMLVPNNSIINQEGDQRIASSTQTLKDKYLHSPVTCITYKMNLFSVALVYWIISW